jgi:hypothetical protein
MSLLGVAPSDEHKAVLRALGNGECIFRDLDNRAGRIGIDLVSEELRDWIDTNPTRAKSRLGQQSQVQHTQVQHPTEPAPRRQEPAGGQQIGGRGAFIGPVPS